MNSIVKILILICGSNLLVSCEKNDSTTSETSLSTVTINTGSTGVFEVMKNDLTTVNNSAPNYVLDWSTAMKKAASLGAGWRLPTKEEWILLIKYKSQIPDLKDAYWTSTSDGSTEAWVMVIFDSNPGITGVNGYNRARAIKKQ